ncbi:MAG: hypothetical protein Aureis2KO_20330 [Aureisphaera sp.]
MNNEALDSDSVIVEKNGSHFLLISFGGVKKGYGMPIFEFKRTLESIPCDKIFVRDHHQCWYQKGSDEQINSREKLLRRLNQLIKEGDYKRIVFLGNSMGGYAAIYFGVLLKVDRILAFSPQTFIDSFRRLRYRDRRWQKQLSAVSRWNPFSAALNLTSHLKKHNEFSGRVNIFFGASDKLDTLHAERLNRFSNVKLIPVEDQDHSVVRYLRDNGDLKKYLEEGFE